MMALPSWREELPVRVRVMQVIVVAMLLGCVVFSIVAILFSPSLPGKDASNLVTMIAVGIAVLSLMPRIVVPMMMVSAGRKRILGELREGAAERGERTRARSFDERENEAGRQLTILLQGKLIVSVALMEGPTFFLLVAYMIERLPIALGAAAVMMVILALHFPTVGWAANWMEGQLRLLKDEF